MVNLELKLAQILAREVSYRSTRSSNKKSERSFLFKLYTPKPSALRVNILPGLMLMIFSLVISLPLLMQNVDVEFVFLLIILVVIVMEGIITIMHSTTFTSVYVTQKLVALFNMLPISEKQMFWVYLYALLFYGSGLSTTFIFIPPTIIGLFKAINGAMPLTMPVLGLISTLMFMIFSYTLGIIFGSYVNIIKRKPILRTLTTVIWLVWFILIFSGYNLMRIMGNVFSRGEAEWLVYLPFVGIILFHRNYLGSIFSGVIMLILTYFSYIIAKRKIRALIQAPSEGGYVKRGVHRPEISIRNLGFISGFIYKDIRLLVREPRRLANFLFNMIFPLIIFIPGILSKPRLPLTGIEEALWMSFSSWVGAFTGYGVEHLFFMEGESAKVLYTLPITKKKIALIKTMTTILFTIPVSLIILILSYIMSQNISSAILSLILVLLSAFSYALISSKLTLMSLPENISAWTEASQRRGVIMLIKIIVLIPVFALPFLISFILKLLGIGIYMLIFLISLFYTLLGFFTYRSLTEEPF